MNTIGPSDVRIDASIRDAKAPRRHVTKRWLGSLLRRVLPVTLILGSLLAIVTPLPVAATACTDSWTNAAGGAWETAGNWSNGVPTSSDTVCITLLNVTVTISGDTESAASLTLGGASGTTTLELVKPALASGTLALSANSNVTTHGEITTINSGVLTMSNGTLTNDGLITGASLSLNGNLTNASDGTIDVAGTTITYGASGNASGTLTNDGTFDVSATGIFNVEGNSDAVSNAGGTIDNLGTFELTGGTGQSFNEGAGTTTGNPIQFSNGNGVALTFSGTGASSFTVLGNATGNTITGDIASGQTVNLQQSALEAGILTSTDSFANGGTINGISHAELIIPTSDTLTNNGSISMPAAVSTVFTISGSVTNTSTGTITAQGTSGSSLVYTGSGATLTNEGTIDVAANDSFLFEGTNNTVENSGGTIGNLGTFELTSGTGLAFNEGAGTTTGNAIEFSNSNGVALTFSGTGASSFAVLGNATGNTISGDIASGQTVTLVQSALESGTLAATASFTNSGTIAAQSSATLNIPSNDKLTNSGTMSVPAASSLTFTGDLDNASGGTIDLGATSTQQGTLRLSGTGTNVTSEGTIDFEMGSSSEFGLLNAGSTGTSVVLGGTAQPLLEGGFSPNVGAEFDVVTGNYSGTFATVNNNFSGDYTHSTFVGLVVGAPPQESTTTTVATSGTPSGFGQSVTFTATVTPSDGGGSVAFFADGSNTAISGCTSQSLTLVSGSTYQATCATSTLAPGNHPIAATYSGDTGFMTSSGSLSGGQSVSQTSTSTSVASSTNPSDFGQSVTFTATVSPSDGNGTVAFFVNGSNTAISGCASQSLTLVSGTTYQATCATTTLPAGTDTIKATYSGDTDFATSSGTLNGGQEVDANDTTTTVTSSVNPSTFGQTVTFTATVSPSDGGGSVAFFADGSNTAITGCSARALSNVSGSEEATCSTSSLSVANHPISATYSGDSGFATSTGSLSNGQTVNAANTTTTATSSPNPSATGQAVTFTATVSPSDGGGTVAFFADGSNTAISGCDAQTLSLVSGSTYDANCTTSALSTGSHPISVTYSGDTDYLTSSGSLASNQSVNLTNTTTTVSSSLNPSTVGTSVTFTATVSPSDGGGSVAFFADGSNTAITGCASQSLTLVSGSTYQATCSTASLTAANHPIAATYSGDTDFATSSGSLSGGQTVNSVGKIGTTTTIAFGTFTPFGPTVPLVATVKPASGSGVPTGTVTFSDLAGNVLGSAPLHVVGGVDEAQISFSATTPCDFELCAALATYSGDAGFTTSTSARLFEDYTLYSGGQVGKTATQIGGLPTPNPAFVGQAVTYNLVLTKATTGGSLIPAGPTLTIIDSFTTTTTLGSATLARSTNGLSATGAFTTTFSVAGNHDLSAIFAGSWALQGSDHTEPVRVNSKTATHFTASASPTSTSAGHAITLRASGLPSTATGTVAFTAGNVTLCTATIRRNTTVQCSTSSNLAAGSYNVTATYSGDNTFQSSTAATQFTISKAATHFVAAATPTRVGSGQVFTITIAGLPANATGRVDITVGPTALVCHVGVTGGPCSIINTGGTLTYTFTATYEGDNNYLGSSATFRVTVT